MNGENRIFRKHSGAAAFFAGIAVWGIADGCWAAVMNNFLHDVYGINELQRGILEFFREMPGLLLIFLLVLLNRFSDWKILRLGTLISLLGVLFLPLPLPLTAAAACMVVFSVGQHLVLPVRSAIAMQVSEPGKEGRSLGFLTGAVSFGTVAGSFLVSLTFWLTPRFRAAVTLKGLYTAVWLIIAALMLVSGLLTFTKNAPAGQGRRPKLYFAGKFRIYYLLELFYGARKQIFLTFAPFVLIKNYGLPTERMALLLGICGAVNVVAAPWVGKLTDRLGCRCIMIWDTVVLFFVCILYGYAGKWFSAGPALALVCVNFLLDSVISTTSLASGVYVKGLASNPEEVSATLSTGISVNHLISILFAPLGGWIWLNFGVETLFTLAAVMSLANSACAMMIPRSSRAGDTSR